MQIILMDKVVNLGGLGDVVRVKDGYARNFLIPTGRARRATTANIAAFETQKAELEVQAATRLAAAQEQGAKLEGYSVQVSQKAGVDGRLFGSITNADIAEALKARGHEVAKADVRLPDGPLKNVGDHSVMLALHTDVVVAITVSVFAAQ